MKHQNCNDGHRLSLQTASSVNYREYFGISALCWDRTCTWRRKAKVQRKRRSSRRKPRYPILVRAPVDDGHHIQKLRNICTQLSHVTTHSLASSITCSVLLQSIWQTSACKFSAGNSGENYLVTVGFYSDVTYSNKRHCLPLGSDATHLQNDTKWSRSCCQWKANDATSAETTFTNSINDAETSWHSFRLLYNNGDQQMTNCTNKRFPQQYKVLIMCDI